jgi:hypothetical protein
VGGEGHREVEEHREVEGMEGEGVMFGQTGIGIGIGTGTGTGTGISRSGIVLSERESGNISNETVLTGNVKGRGSGRGQERWIRGMVHLLTGRGMRTGIENGKGKENENGRERGIIVMIDLDRLNKRPSPLLCPTLDRFRDLPDHLHRPRDRSVSEPTLAIVAVRRSQPVQGLQRTKRM